MSCERDEQGDDAVGGKVDVADGVPGFAEDIGRLEVDLLAAPEQMLAGLAR